MNQPTLKPPILTRREAPVLPQVQAPAPVAEEVPAFTDVVNSLSEYENGKKNKGIPSSIPCPMCLKEGIETELDHTHTNTVEMSSEWWMTMYYGCPACNRRYKSERAILHGLRRGEDPEGIVVGGSR